MKLSKGRRWQGDTDEESRLERDERSGEEREGSRNFNLI